MGQLGFFDLSRRSECLDAKNDPLVAIAALVPWECFRPKLRGGADQCRASHARDCVS
jgi:IS5 family transposase